MMVALAARPQAVSATRLEPKWLRRWWWWWSGRVACMTCLSMPYSSMHLIQVAGHLGVRLPATPLPLPRPNGGVNPGPVPVHRALQAHLQPPEIHLRHPIEQAEHLHDFHDLWHDAPISSTPREQQLRDIAVFCTLNHWASVVAHNRRVNDQVQARIPRVATVGSRLFSPKHKLRN